MTEPQKTEPRKGQNLEKVLINVTTVILMKNIKNPPVICSFSIKSGKIIATVMPQSPFSMVPDQDGGRGHYVCPQQKRRTEPQGQGRLCLH